MVSLETWPSAGDLYLLEAKHPGYMYPNRVPIAVVAKKFISTFECEWISTMAAQAKSYKHPECGATTSELGHDRYLENIMSFALRINEAFFGFDLDPEPVSWMQTYERDDQYQLHMDGAPGQMRKLTAVVLLSDEDSYGDGQLELFYHPERFIVPKSQGTMVVFPSWILHKVHTVTSGSRQSINMGFWGPAFK